MTRTPAPATVIAPRASVRAHVVQVWQYRELLVALVRKELKVKYKNSALGFVWSMLNPAMYLVVYYVVFQVLLKSGIPRFPIWLLCGLLVWNLFTNSLAGATGSITGNGALVNKVAFPREILPLAAVGANLIHFLFQGLVLLGALLVYQRGVDLGYVWLIPVALVVVLILASAVAVFLSAVNVYARDTQHLLELVLLAWFWATPIVYQWSLQSKMLVDRGLPSSLTMLNPVTPIVLAFQRGIYGQVRFTDANGVVNQLLPNESALWYLRNLTLVGIGSLVLLWLATALFIRLEGNFAEEL